LCFPPCIPQAQLDQTEDKLTSAEAEILRLAAALAEVTAAEAALREALSQATRCHADAEAALRDTVSVHAKSLTQLPRAHSSHSSSQMKESEEAASAAARVAAARCAAAGWLQRRVLTSTRERLEAALVEARDRGEVRVDVCF
jgi:septal ring factor EnvC (AmiA/AmiB activator)